ncbi:antibiotic biosynthesis monooxygenase [soil metagenome]
MFIAMNRFQVLAGEEPNFETMWKSRDSYLDEVPGFVSFHLLRGATTDDGTLFASHTVWESRAAFEAWTKSEVFRKAHANAGGTRPLYAGAPRLEVFDPVAMDGPAAR